jgi:hypothetical protein
VPLTSVIDHDAAHKLRGDGKEMSAVLPLRMSFVRELKVSVIQQRSCLQGMAGSLPAHVMLRQTLKLWLHERDQFLQCAWISVAPLAEQLGDLLLWGCRRQHAMNASHYQPGSREMPADL